MRSHCICCCCDKLHGARRTSGPSDAKRTRAFLGPPIITPRKSDRRVRLGTPDDRRIKTACVPNTVVQEHGLQFASRDNRPNCDEVQPPGCVRKHVRLLDKSKFPLFSSFVGICAMRRKSQKKLAFTAVVIGLLRKFCVP